MSFTKTNGFGSLSKAQSLMEVGQHLVCAVYQGMYLYHTEVVCCHAPNSTRQKTKSLLNSGLLTVSLCRKEHLQNLQWTVATEITHLENFKKYNVEDLEQLRLGVPKEASVLVSLLVTSIQTTINELQEWASLSHIKGMSTI